MRKLMRKLRGQPSFANSYSSFEANPQQQCPLFSKLSPELRIAVFEAMLTDPCRLLHICTNVVLNDRGRMKRGTRAKLAHVYCHDMESTFPSWQHKCYGDWSKEKNGPRQPVTGTNDSWLSLLLTCRLVYSKASPILYSGNIFHFQGSPGLLEFRSSLSIIQWQYIRNVHIGAVVEYNPTTFNEWWPRDTTGYWKRCCECLHELPRLDILRIDMWVSPPGIGPFSNSIWDAITMPFLQPLMGVTAATFEIDINACLSQELISSMEKANIKLVSRMKPWNPFYSDLAAWSVFHRLYPESHKYLY